MDISRCTVEESHTHIHTQEGKLEGIKCQKSLEKIYALNPITKQHCLEKTNPLNVGVYVGFLFYRASGFVKWKTGSNLIKGRHHKFIKCVYFLIPVKPIKLQPSDFRRKLKNETWISGVFQTATNKVEDTRSHSDANTKYMHVNNCKYQTLPSQGWCSQRHDFPRISQTLCSCILCLHLTQQCLVSVARAYTIEHPKRLWTCANLIETLNRKVRSAKKNRTNTWRCMSTFYMSSVRRETKSKDKKMIIDAPHVGEPCQMPGNSTEKTLKDHNDLLSWKVVTSQNEQRPLKVIIEGCYTIGHARII